MFLEFSAVGLAPAALIVLAGMYVRARQADRKFARRWLFFLFSVVALLFATQFLALRWEVYRLGALLQPALVGTLVALLVHLGATRELWSRKAMPMIFRDQTWCYEGGDDYYRLGYVHQPGFGCPPDRISVQIHAAEGEPPEPSWPCDDALEKAKSQSPWQ